MDLATLLGIIIGSVLLVVSIAIEGGRFIILEFFQYFDCALGAHLRQS